MNLMGGLLRWFCMDRQETVDDLAHAENHVARGLEHVSRRRRIVAELKGAGRDTIAARELLALLEDFLMMHVASRDRLRQELARPTQDQ
jgi:hemerythrin